MNLTTFEVSFNKTILKRGRDYYKQGLVESLDRLTDTRWQAEVDGTYTYTVTIDIDSTGIILARHCDCPFEGDCKHIAAVLYELKDQFKTVPITKIPSPANKLSFEQLLQTQTKEQLINLIQKIAKSNKKVKNDIELLFTPKEKDTSLAAAKKIIMRYLNTAKDRSGFISWRQTSYAIEGIEIIQERIHALFDDEEYMNALQLAFLCFNSALNALEYADDSSGEIGGCIDESLHLASEAVSHGAETWDKKQIKQAYALLIKESQNPVLDGWSDWKIEILSASIPLCMDDETQQQFIALLQSQQLPKSNNWGDNYFNKELRELHFQVISLKSSSDELEKFLEQNLGDENMRTRVIESSLNQQDYEKALKLAIDGVLHDANSLGLVSKWNRYMYKAYTGLNNIAEMKKLAMHLVINGDYDYYPEVKILHADNWATTLESLLNTLHKEESYLYGKIIVEENQYKRILAYCQDEPMLIESYYTHIRAHYYEDVCALFIEYIETSAKQASDRTRYKDVCRIIKTMHEAGYQVESSHLINDLMQTYARRPAFVDELQKISK